MKCVKRQLKNMVINSARSTHFSIKGGSGNQNESCDLSPLLLDVCLITSARFIVYTHIFWNKKTFGFSE
jgi:hypothetical protein